MSDNIDITPGSGKTIAFDDISSVWYPRVKLCWGADGSVVDASTASAAAIPIQRRTSAGLETGALVATSVTIDQSSNTLSSEVDLGIGFLLVAIGMPAAWTTATLTFSVASASAGTFNNLYDDAGSEVEFAAAASRHIMIANPATFYGARYMKIRSGTSGTPVTQASSRTVVFFTRPI